MSSARSLRCIAVVLVAPAAIYPLLMVLLLAFDTALGDAGALHHFRHESPGALVRGLLVDYRDALPATYAFGIALLALLCVGRRRFARRSGLADALIGVAAACALGIYFEGLEPGWSLGALVLAGAAWSWLAGLALGQCFATGRV